MTDDELKVVTDHELTTTRVETRQEILSRVPYLLVDPGQSYQNFRWRRMRVERANEYGIHIANNWGEMTS